MVKTNSTPRNSAGGPLRIARLLEAYGMLWIDQALNRGRGQNFAFAITTRLGAA
jgi:hypothetical protein